MTQALIAMPFFFAGYVMKKTELLLENPRYDRYLLFISIIVLTICILIFETIGSPHLDFLYLDLSGNALLIYIFSTIVVVSVLLICKSIKWLPVISYMGRFSVVILGLHWLFIKAYSLGYSYLISPDLNMPFRFVIVVLACWISIPVVLYFVPGMVAQKDIIRFPKNTKK